MLAANLFGLVGVVALAIWWVGVGARPHESAPAQRHAAPVRIAAPPPSSSNLDDDSSPVSLLRPLSITSRPDLDAEVRSDAPLPAWAAGRNFQAQVAEADPDVSVAGVACGDNVCRLDVRQQPSDDRHDMALRLASNLIDDGAAVFAHPGADRSRVFVYLMKP